MIATRPFSPYFGLPLRSANALERWFDALHMLSLDDWLDAMRVHERSGPRVPSLDAARNAVTIAIAQHNLEVTAWFIRDVVATATFRHPAHFHRLSRRARRQLVDARWHAEWAALAIATRPWLSDEHFELLHRPFNWTRTFSISDSTTPSPRPATRRAGEDRSSLLRARAD